MSRPAWEAWLRAGALVILVVAGGVLGDLSRGLSGALYGSTTTLLVGDLRGGSALSKQDLKTSSQATARYAELIRSKAVLAPVSDTFEGNAPWQELKDRVHVASGVDGLPFLYVTVYGSTSASAQALGDAVGHEVVRLSLQGSAEPTGRFQKATEKSKALEEAIDDAEARISRLQARLNVARSGRAIALLQERINEEADLIIEWQESYLATLSSVPASPNGVEILMPASSNSTRLGPDARLRTVLGAALGAVIGLATVFAPSRHPESRHHGRIGRAGRKPLAQEVPARRGRRQQTDPWARASLARPQRAE